MFSLQLKAISRSAGRSAAGAVAYVTSSVGEDEFTGRRFDYTRKGGTLSVDVVGFEGPARDLADRLDRDEKRVNSTVCREAIVALPHQLSNEERRSLAKGLALAMKERWDVDSVVALHRPPRSGDERNFHAHIVFSTRNGEGKKTRILDERKTGALEVEWLRSEASRRIQASLRRKSLPAEEWDHRSYEKRGIAKAPTRHEGPLATELRRRGETIHSLERALSNDETKREREEFEEVYEAYGRLRGRIAQGARQAIERSRIARDAAERELARRRGRRELARNRRFDRERKRRLGHGKRRGMFPDDPPLGNRL